MTDSASRRAPIGVFDSGVGGLTVVSALMRQLPSESMLYLGDTARLPYGTKSAETVARYTRRNIDFLVARGVKAVVVACNTASAIAVDRLDSPVPVWGVIEPGAAAALAVHRRGPIGVLATESTVSSDAYGRALRRLQPDVRVLSQACPLFVPLVEEGWAEDPVTETIAARYLEPLIAEQVDTLVLGCTHYPVLASVIGRLAGEGVELVDSAQAVAKLVASELSALDLAVEPAVDGTASTPAHHLCVTDLGERFQHIADQLLRQFRALDAGAPAIGLELVEV